MKLNHASLIIQFVHRTNLTVNKRQQILCVCALFLFLLSWLIVPWTLWVQEPLHAQMVESTVFAPIWWNPSIEGESGHWPHLQVVFVEWAAITAAFLALFFVLRTAKNKGE